MSLNLYGYARRKCWLGASRSYTPKLIFSFSIRVIRVCTQSLWQLVAPDENLATFCFHGIFRYIHILILYLESETLFPLLVVM